MLVKNAFVVSSKAILKADVRVEKGTFVEISSGLAQKRGEHVVDAAGLFLLPGLIDSHVHFREPGEENKETFLSGGTAALAGGITTICDMPNNKPPITTVEALKAKEKAAKKCPADARFFFGASNDNFADCRAAARDPLVCGLKIYTASTTGNLLVTDQEKILRHLKNFPRTKPVVFHAEEESMVKVFTSIMQHDYAEKAHAGHHWRGRPTLAATTSIRRLLRLARQADNRSVHFTHVSTGAEAREVSHAKRHGARATCDTTPNYLFLSAADGAKIGNNAKLNPPLRSEKERSELWQVLQRGEIDCIATDHAPHPLAEKKKHYWDAPGGIPGVQTLLPLLLDAVGRHRLRLQDVVRMCCENPAQLYGLKGKGFVAKGMDADFVLVDMSGRKTVRNEDMKSKAKWTPYDGWKLKGRIAKVFRAGKAA